MGKKRKARSFNNKQGQDKRPSKIPYEEIPLYNDQFEAYYKAQQIIPEEEWPIFLEYCRKPLPITFRFTGSNEEATSLSNLFLTKFFSSSTDSTTYSTTITTSSSASSSSFSSSPSLPSPTVLPWYPGIAWQLDVSRSMVRKTEQYQQFHAYLMNETELGNVARQEAVSMLPPLFLQVEPHHHVIDLCAAPGSKTAQLLEFTQYSKNGLVVANDADAKRAYTLVHQLKRTQSPHLLVTYHPAQHYPTLFTPPSSSSSSSSSNASSTDMTPGLINDPVHAVKPTPFQFDRVLADVPCSGDGTLRKNGMIWKTWKPHHGLHLMQCRILMRGIQLAKIGATIVYSTCTLNPIENEAVIATILQRCQGLVQLMDVSHVLPKLLRRPGLTTWKVASLPTSSSSSSSSVVPPEYYSSWDEVPQALRSKLTQSYFPPKDGHALGLEKCVRVYPHLQNTGGFFVAVLKKVGEPDFQGLTCFGESLEELPLRHQRGVGLKKKKLKPRPFHTLKNLNLNLSTSQVQTDQNEVNPEQCSKEGVLKKSDSLDPLMETCSTEPLLMDDESDQEEEEEEEEEENAEEEERIDLDIDETCIENEGDVKTGEEKVELNTKKKEPVSESSAEGHMNQEHYEDPFIFLNEEDEELKSIRATYAMPDDFPYHQLVVRSLSPHHRSIYFCSDSVKHYLKSKYAFKLKVVHTGVKVFSRAYEQSLTTHRFNNEGVELLAPFIHRQIVEIDVPILIQLLKEDRPFLHTFPPSLFANVQKGGILFRFQQYRFSGWLAPCSVGLLVNKKERQSLLFRFNAS